jgi:hypothetical protein
VPSLLLRVKKCSGLQAPPLLLPHGKIQVNEETLGSKGPHGPHMHTFHPLNAKRTHAASGRVKIRTMIMPVSCPGASRWFVQVCLCMALSCKAFLLKEKRKKKHQIKMQTRSTTRVHAAGKTVLHQDQY